MKPVVIAYTDGGCRNNGKPDAIGGYGIVMMFTDSKNKTHTKEFSKAFKCVTNNQMELQAVIDCLKHLKQPCEVVVMTDSKYVCQAVNEKWINKWMSKGWKNSSNQPVKNKEQWIELSKLLSIHQVRFFWVKGHADNEYNNRCDELANIAMDSYNTL